MERRLMRSRKHRIIAGVCGGIAEYFQVDPTVVRLIWVIIGLAYVPAVTLYIAAAIIMPESGVDNSSFSEKKEESGGFGRDYEFSTEDWKEPPKYDSEKSKNMVGAIFIIIGLMLLGKTVFNFDWISYKNLMPAILIVIGAYLIYRGGKRTV